MDRGDPCAGRRGGTVHCDERVWAPHGVYTPEAVVNRTGIAHPLRQALCAAAASLAVACAPPSSTAPTLERRGDETRPRDQQAGAATATLGREALAARRAMRFEDLLLGIPGVYVIGAGAARSVRIRGINTFFGTTEPLYVLDGMPLQHGSRAALDNINPADVARIEVLKDAASTAFWGSRGANGVIVITTKRAFER